MSLAVTVSPDNTSVISLINNINSVGPSTLPCGTPLVIGILLEITLDTLTTCVLPARKLVNQHNRFPLIP